MPQLFSSNGRDVLVSNVSMQIASYKLSHTLTKHVHSYIFGQVIVLVKFSMQGTGKNKLNRRAQCTSRKVSCNLLRLQLGDRDV